MLVGTSSTVRNFPLPFSLWVLVDMKPLTSAKILYFCDVSCKGSLDGRSCDVFNGPTTLPSWIYPEGPAKVNFLYFR